MALFSNPKGIILVGDLHVYSLLDVIMFERPCITVQCYSIDRDIYTHIYIYNHFFAGVQQLHFSRTCFS